MAVKVNVKVQDAGRTTGVVVEASIGQTLNLMVFKAPPCHHVTNSCTLKNVDDDPVWTTAFCPDPC